MTTPEHPFYVKGRYILAGFLSVGMSLTGFAGEQIEIQETEIIRYEKPQKVYNFSIEGTENYYVGEQGVLVHNVEGCPPGNEARKKNTETKKNENEIIDEMNAKRDELGNKHKRKYAAYGSRYKDGEIYVEHSGNGKCVEDNLIEKYGSDIKLGEVKGWRRNKLTGELEYKTIPVCRRCQTKYTKDQFFSGIKHQEGGIWDGK